MTVDEGRYFARFLELFSGLPRAGPGSDAATRRALDLLPSGERRSVLDLGCGPGAQTLSLAAALPEARIIALDLLPSMVTETHRRCERAALLERVTALVGDMARPPVPPASQDLLWCEAAIYNLGVEQALKTWRPLLSRDGCAVFSEPLWLMSDPPREVLDWWVGEYPAMTDRPGVERAISAAGYQLVATFVLPVADWWDDYYRPLEEKIPGFLARHPNDAAAAAVADDATAEIDILRRYAEWYSYGFFIVRPHAPTHSAPTTR
jgi:ubiquinone/menaquinone biosynthesis C-methylase UbiE